MRPRKSVRATFPPKEGRKLPKEHDYWIFCLFRTNHNSVYSVNSAVVSRIDGILFCSFRNKNRFQKNTITANSVYSNSGIVPKEHALIVSARKVLWISIVSLDKWRDISQQEIYPSWMVKVPALTVWQNFNLVEKTMPSENSALIVLCALGPAALAIPFSLLFSIYLYMFFCPN